MLQKIFCRVIKFNCKKLQKEGIKMQRKKIKSILCILCLLLNLVFPILRVNVCAEGPTTTLFFKGQNELVDGKIVYSGGSQKGTIELVKKIDSPTEDYKHVDITKQFMEIDLKSENYFLKATSSNIAEDPDDIWIVGGLSYNTLYIGKTEFNVSVNPYVRLDPAQFSGNLSIELIKKPTNLTHEYPDDISINATYDGFGMTVRLNGERVGNESKRITGTGKGYASGDMNNSIGIQTAFGGGYIGSVTVNGKEISVPEGTKEELNFSVEPAKSYTIVVTKSKDPSSGNNSRTIIWESDKNNNTSLKDDELLKNGTAEILDIKDRDGNSIGLKNVRQDIEKNNGWADVEPGSKVIFKLKPYYGYQLTSIRINDEILTAREDESTFEYIMPNTNVHLSGIFEKVDDQVKIESDKVKSGTIKLNGSEIDSGSMLLSVKDANLTEKQVANFKEKAKGYEISSYLGINLEQILYKGTADNVWSNLLNDLKNSATVTLQLGEEINGNEIVLVHEKHDGTYEIIPTTYDASTNTLTFETSSFSNYAIANKLVNEAKTDKPTIGTDTVGKSNTSIPKTGDSLVKYILPIALGFSSLIVLLLTKKKARRDIYEK